jgi:hypothetical protein
MHKSTLRRRLAYPVPASMYAVERERAPVLCPPQGGRLLPQSGGFEGFGADIARAVSRDYSIATGGSERVSQNSA